MGIKKYKSKPQGLVQVSQHKYVMTIFMLIDRYFIAAWKLQSGTY